MANTKKCHSCGRTVKEEEIKKCPKCGSVCCWNCYPQHKGHCERGAKQRER